MKTEGILHITISVTDMDRAKAFYEDIVGFETYHMNPRGTMCFMNAGRNVVVLTSMPNHVSPNPDGLDIHGTLFHHAFIVDHEEFDRVMAHFAANDIPVFVCDDINHAAVPGFRHAYIKDPDGNAIEIAGRIPEEATV